MSLKKISNFREKIVYNKSSLKYNYLVISQKTADDGRAAAIGGAALVCRFGGMIFGERFAARALAGL